MRACIDIGTTYGDCFCLRVFPGGDEPIKVCSPMTDRQLGSRLSNILHVRSKLPNYELNKVIKMGTHV